MDPVTLSIIFGGLVVPVTSWVKNVAWPSWVKTVLALVLSGVGGVVSLIIDGKLSDVSWQGLVANIGVAFAASQLFYQTYFKNTTVNDKLEQVNVV